MIERRRGGRSGEVGLCTRNLLREWDAATLTLFESASLPLLCSRHYTVLFLVTLGQSLPSKWTYQVTGQHVACLQSRLQLAGFPSIPTTCDRTPRGHGEPPALRDLLRECQVRFMSISTMTSLHQPQRISPSKYDHSTHSRTLFHCHTTEWSGMVVLM